MQIKSKSVNLINKLFHWASKVGKVFVCFRQVFLFDFECVWSVLLNVTKLTTETSIDKRIVQLLWAFWFLKADKKIIYARDSNRSGTNFQFRRKNKRFSKVMLTKVFSSLWTFSDTNRLELWNESFCVIILVTLRAKKSSKVDQHDGWHER